MTIFFRVLRFSLALSLTLLPCHALGATRSFREAIALIAEENPSLTAQEQEARASAERSRSLEYYYLPQLSLRAEKSTQAPLLHIDQSRPSSSLGLELRTNLFRFGADQATAEAGNIALKKNAVQLESARIKLEGEACSQLLDIIAARMELQVLRKIEGTRNDLLKVARRQFAKGLIAEQDLRKIEVDLGSAKASTTDAEAQVQRNESLVRPYLGNDSLKTEWPFLSQSPSSTKIQTISEHDIPSVEARRLETLELDHLVTAARAKQWPSIDLALGLDRRLEGPSASENTASAAIVMTVPIFDRFESSSAYRAAISSKAAADAELSAAQIAADTALQSATYAVKAAETAVAEREQLLAVSQRLYQDNLARFERGLVTVNELSLDESRLYETELASLRSFRALNQGIVTLCHAKGKLLRDCALAFRDR